MSKHAGSQRGLPVDGVERQTSEGWTFPARNPADGETLWQVPDAGVADVHAAAQAAWRAFHETQWSTDTALRADAIGRLQDELVARADELALLLAAETGVPVSMRAAHLDAPIAGMRADQQHEPPGVAVVLTPATSPLAVAIEEVGRMLVAGGTVVLKPAPEAASAALELGRIALDILPRGVLNVVSTRDVDVAIALTLDHRVDEVSFTGSSVPGSGCRWRRAAPASVVRVDVGGPVTICAADDDDLAAVVSAAAAPVAANAGQGCRLPAAWSCPRTATTRRSKSPSRRWPRSRSATRPSRHRCAGRCARGWPATGVLRYLDLARAEGGDGRARRARPRARRVVDRARPSSAG